MSWLKNKLVILYDMITSRTCTVSIGDVMNIRDQVEHNQFLTTTRVLDIEDYCNRGLKNFQWQNTVSMAAYGNKHHENEGNIAFEKLIESYKKNGYKRGSLFTLDKTVGY